MVRTLHEIPVLPKDVIELAAERPYLAGSDLAESAQRVRFTPTVMDVDETSKLWGMLHQTPYALSVVYQASLVLIEGRETPVPAKPVERSDVRVLPFGAPGAPVPPGAARRPRRERTVCRERREVGEPSERQGTRAPSTVGSAKAARQEGAPPRRGPQPGRARTGPAAKETRVRA